MTSVFVVAVLVSAAVAVVFGVRFVRGPDRDQYLAKNERVVAELPKPHGAHEYTRQILRGDEPLFGEQLSHTVGYTTYVTYTVPATTTSTEIVQVYTKSLGLAGWQGKSWPVDRTLFACFSRNGATVSVQTEGMLLGGGVTQKNYGVAVNHRGGSCD